MSIPPAGSGDDERAAIAAIVRESVAILRAPNPTLEPQLQQYLEALLVANRGINLVSRKDTLAHLRRFTRECLFLASLLESEASAHGDAIGLLDIGSGGGFPGIILKLAMPQVETVLLEGTQKKARFLAEVCG